MIAHLMASGQDWQVGSPRLDVHGGDIPNILTPGESLDLIIGSGLSLSRLGDGELCIASGTAVGAPPFQDYDPLLADRLREILSVQEPRCLVGLNRAHFYDTARTNVPRPFLDNWIAASQSVPCLGLAQYVAAEVTCATRQYEQPERVWNSWFERLSEWIAGMRILLVTGEASRDNLYFYTRWAKEVRTVPCPRRNAWRERGNILEAVRRINDRRDWTVVLACGPAASVLAWDLSREGMTALDLGHLSMEAAWRDRGMGGRENDRAFFSS